MPWCMEVTGGFGPGISQVFKLLENATAYSTATDFPKWKHRIISEVAALHRKAYIRQIYSGLCPQDGEHSPFVMGLEANFIQGDPSIAAAARKAW